MTDQPIEDGFEEISPTDEDDVLFTLDCTDESELAEMEAAGLKIWSAIPGKHYRMPDGVKPTPEDARQLALVSKGFALVSEPLRRHMAAMARVYIKMGLVPIVIPPVCGLPVKRPMVEKWQEQRITVEECQAAFVPRCTNLGILLGAPSGDLTDLDVDAYKIGLGHVAIRFLEAYMPAPNHIFGRYSAPNSHWLYFVPGARTEQFKDVDADGKDGAVLLEVRSTGGQTVFPPSTHETTGERISWSDDYEPRLVDPLPAGNFRRHVAWCAAGILLVKHYPAEGARNLPTKYLAAMLAKLDWTDSEAMSFVQIVAEQAHDGKILERLQEVQATFKNHEQGKAIKGASGLEEFYGKRLALRLMDWLKLSDEISDVEEEEFEISAHEWPADPSQEVYAGLVGEFVRAWEPHTEASPIALALQFLTALGSSIGRRPFFAVGGDDHHLNLDVCLVGPISSARKGQSWGCVEHTFSKVDLGLKITINTARGLSSGEGLISAVRDPRSEPDKKGNVRVVDHGVNDKRLCVFESEFASVLRRMSKEGNTLSEIIRQAWDSGTLGTMTKAAPLHATGAHISIITHVTFSELRRFMTEVSAENGFANRFVFAAIRRVRVLPDPGRPSLMELRALATRIAGVIEAGARISEMHRSPDAVALWETMYGVLTAPRTGRVHNAVTARAAAQVLRLSMLYAIQDGSAIIDVKHIRSAMALWDYAERTSQFVFGISTGDKLSDFIYDAIKKAGIDGLTQTELRVMTRHMKAAAKDGLKFALTMLVGENLIRGSLVPRPGGVAGAGTTHWCQV